VDQGKMEESDKDMRRMQDPQDKKRSNARPLTTRPHTKRGWCLWGLRWFIVILFSLAFCVGLLLSVSWKILLCLAVIPVTYIFLPKKVQSWIWVCLTGLILGLFIWVLLPELNKENWKPYQFEHDLQALNNVHLPAGIDNAADRYEAVFAKHGETIFDHSLSFADGHKAFLAPWNPQDYPELDMWLNGFEPALRQLVEISYMEQCRFAIPHDLPSINPQLRRDNQIKRWVRLLISSANRDIYLKQPELALQKLLAIPRMAQHLYQQETLFDQATAFHIEVMAIRALEAFVIYRCEDPDTLVQIEQAFSGIDPQWPKNWRRILLREKLVAKNIAGNLYEINRKGRIRMSRNAIPALAKGLNFRVPSRLKKQNLSKAATIGLWLFMPSSPDGVGTMIDERFDHYSRLVQRGEQLEKIALRYAFLQRGANYKSLIDWRVMEMVQYYWTLDGQFLRHQAIVHRIRILSALKRYYLEHKCWPDRLTELQIKDRDDVLVDPLCGKPFVYEKLDDGFRLYSLGPNGIDDGGLNVRKEHKDDILIWPGMHTRNGAGSERGDP